MKAKLALDLGTKTGWAMLVDGVTLSGTLKLGSGPDRYLKLWSFLREVLREGDTVAFEDVKRHAGTIAAHVYGGLKAITQTACCEVGAACEGVPVGTIKKHATGKGNADKKMMIQAARRRGFNPIDDNEADALALLHYMVSA